MLARINREIGKNIRLFVFVPEPLNVREDQAGTKLRALPEFVLLGPVENKPGSLFCVHVLGHEVRVIQVPHEGALTALREPGPR